MTNETATKITTQNSHSAKLAIKLQAGIAGKPVAGLVIMQAYPITRKSLFKIPHALLS